MILDTFNEIREFGGDKVETIRITMDGEGVDQSLLKKYPGYVVAEHIVVLTIPRVSKAETDDMKAALDMLNVVKETTWKEAAEKTKLKRPDGGGTSNQ